MSFETEMMIYKMMGVLYLLVVWFVALVACGTAIWCSIKKLRPVGAWVVATGWLLLGFVALMYLVGDLVLINMIGYDVMRWVFLLFDLISLLAGLVVAVGFFLCKPLEKQLPDGEEVSHG